MIWFHLRGPNGTCPLLVFLRAKEHTKNPSVLPFGGLTERRAQMAPDQVSFYDESLKKQIEGSFVSDGKEIHVSSGHGTRTAALLCFELRLPCSERR
jgi:hypothetical protein